MRSFFKIFFASLLALVVFTLLAVFFLVGFLGGIASKERPRVEAKSVLVLDLGQAFPGTNERKPFVICQRREQRYARSCMM